jgi:formamidopyrimidine-DNA glycosylase
MTGQLLWLERSPIFSPHTRLRLFFEGDRELRFVDIRTFGKVWWIPPDRPITEIVTGLQTLGVEPLSAGFTTDYFYTRLQRRSCPIKILLLDQRVVAGLGNIYADESLFKAGILPIASAQSLTRKQGQDLRLAIISVLEVAIAAGGTTFSDFRGVTGINGNYGGEAWVYGRKQQPCRVCGTAIARIKLGGRSTHFCPNCQR